MSGLVCPWWFAYLFDNPLRRFIHDPEKILGPHVRPGMTVADLGCGMGYFSLGLARLVGSQGRVVSIDIQEEMLTALARRAARAGLSDRIRPVLARPDDLGIDTEIDFALAFWMVHETPSAYAFFRQVRKSLTEGGRILVVEPRAHVPRKRFSEILEAGGRAGLGVLQHPPVIFSHTALLAR